MQMEVFGVVGDILRYLRDFVSSWPGGLEDLFGYISYNSNFDNRPNVHYSAGGHCK